MARFSERRPYHKIKISGQQFYVQFAFIEAIKKTECAIYNWDKRCIVKASVVCKEPDEFTKIRGEQEAFKSAMDKYMDIEEKLLHNYIKSAYSEIAYFEKQLTYKVFKMTPLELEQATK